MKLPMFSKKAITGFIVGAFILAGVATPFIVHAADLDKGGPGFHHRQPPTPEQIAQHLSEKTGLTQADILTYHANGMDFRDIGRAAFLASASGQSITDIISHKTTSNTWRDVAKELGITKEQMKATRTNMIANKLATKSGIAKESALNLLAQGYHARDISKATLLAKNTNKSIEDVLSLKKINTRWSDIATSLGVDPSLLKQGHDSHRGSHHRFDQ